jgi:hypothetical protein
LISSFNNTTDTFLFALWREPIPATESKYLGVIISDDLHWEKQVNRVSQKASNILNFIRKNLKHCPPEAKTIACNSLVRSTLEYSTSIWDTYFERDKFKIERVNRRASRFITGDYSSRSSVTRMLEQLEHTKRSSLTNSSCAHVQDLTPAHVGAIHLPYPC